LALLNQQTARTSSGAAGVGNINPRLYSLAQTTPAAFHDVTRGNNTITVTCTIRSRNCTAGSFGYSAGAGYDLASGLGSIDAFQLVNSWNGPVTSISRAVPKLTVSASSTQITSGQGTTLTAVVAGVDSGSPTGTVVFKLGSTVIGTASLATSANGSIATMNVSSSSLHVGANTIAATYSGGSIYNTATASISITLAASNTTTITGMGNAASFRPDFSPGMLFTIMGTLLAPSTWSGNTPPLPTQAAGVRVTVNGIAAPLLYVSPTQINAQIPYAVPVGVGVTVAVNTNGSTTTSTITLASAAPGIFTDANFAPVPNTSVARGGVGTLYVTGAGSSQSVSVTIGGIVAPVLFAGTPSGVVGVTQINYQVPQSAPIGPTPIVVFVGNTNSPPATLTVAP